MAIKTIEKARIQNLNKEATIFYEETEPLKQGEVAFVLNNGQVDSMVVGDGITRAYDLYNSNPSRNKFYAGQGANYSLPVASEENLGGIKINPNYNSVDANQQLLPKFGLIHNGNSYSSASNKPYTEWVTTREVGHLLIPGDLYVQDIYADSIKQGIIETNEKLSVSDKYIDIHKVEGEGDPINPLGEGEYSGLRIFNYMPTISGLEDTQDNRFIAELSINNKGTLYYAKASNNATIEGYERRQVLTIPTTVPSGILETNIVNGEYTLNSKTPHNLTLMITHEGEDTQQISYLPFGNSDVSSEIFIPQNYCTQVKVGNKTYSLDNSGKTIDLGSDILLTEEHKNLISGSIQNITINGKVLSKTEDKNVNFEITSSNNSIGINDENVGKIDLSHPDYKVADDPSTDTTTTIGGMNAQNELITGVDVVVGINRDEGVGAEKGFGYGHVISYSLSKLDFTNILERLARIEEQLGI